MYRWWSVYFNLHTILQSNGKSLMPEVSILVLAFLKNTICDLPLDVCHASPLFQADRW